MFSRAPDKDSPAPWLTRRRFLGLMPAGAALGATGAGYGHFEERHRLEVTRTDIAIPGLPPALSGLRIAHLTDWHFEDHPFYDRIIAAARLEHPDLIALTGDYLEDTALIDPLVDRLRRLDAPLGVWAVSGNHDYWCGAMPGPLAPALSRAGVNLLMNESVRLAHKGTSFSLGGVDYDNPMGDKFAQCQRERNEAFHLQLTHLPVGFDHPSNHAQLTLAGHTHGGQIRLPWIGNPALPYGCGGYSDGLYHRPDGRQLYVSRGLGTFLVPVRFLCPPELALLTLRAA